MLSVQRNVHQLLCNTLPAPIVAEVASGHVEVAHRYEQVAMHMHMPYAYAHATCNMPHAHAHAHAHAHVMCVCVCVCV